MRKLLLTSTAIAFAIATGAPALAADVKTGTSGAVKVESDTNGSVKMKSDTEMSTEGKVDAERYGSLSKTSSFDGVIEGGFSAEELIGTDVVDANGDTVGEIADVLIDANNRAELVLVDVGGFLGLGEKRIAMSINDLSKHDGKLVTTKTEAELEAMASYQQDGDGWFRTSTQ